MIKGLVKPVMSKIEMKDAQVPVRKQSQILWLHSRGDPILKPHTLPIVCYPGQIKVPRSPLETFGRVDIIIRCTLTA